VKSLSLSLVYQHATLKSLF